MCVFSVQRVKGIQIILCVQLCGSLCGVISQTPAPSRGTDEKVPHIRFLNRESSDMLGFMNGK